MTLITRYPTYIRLGGYDTDNATPLDPASIEDPLLAALVAVLVPAGRERGLGELVAMCAYLDGTGVLACWFRRTVFPARTLFYDATYRDGLLTLDHAPVFLPDDRERPKNLPVEAPPPVLGRAADPFAPPPPPPAPAIPKDFRDAAPEPPPAPRKAVSTIDPSALDGRGRRRPA